MNAAITSGIVVPLILLFMVIVLAKTVRIVPQAQSQVVERLGRYSRTLSAGLHILVPFVDRVTFKLDLREQVVTFQPQPVITEDNLVVSIDSVIYFQVTDPKRRHVRDPELHLGCRAVDSDDAAQRGRQYGPSKAR